MYISNIEISGFRQFGTGESAVALNFKPGVTALIGKNDSGKTAIIDAIRFALLSRDQHYIPLQREDFYVADDGTEAMEITIICILSDLSVEDRGAFAEYLTYEEGAVRLIVTYAARRLAPGPSTRRWVEVSVRSGKNGAGPSIEASVRELLASAYLKPLRDAERELSSGRGSRLSQILYHFDGISDGNPFDPETPPATAADMADLSLLGLSELFSHNVKTHGGVVSAENAINNDYLKALLLAGDKMVGRIGLTEGGSDDARLRQILERLELGLLDQGTVSQRGKYGLGSNNILYMACELLLLGREPDGLPLLLIEEPEAHLHPQRQLRLMQFLKQASQGKAVDDEGRDIQIILSTHSPNLASGLPVANTILLDGVSAFELSEGHTKLSKNDYSFLERFLDATKANLFFAHGVLIVEGDGETLILPAIAKALGLDLATNGVSIVNVKGTGLRRFSRIFQRQVAEAPWIDIPVACLADLDVMPNLAPQILGLVKDEDDDAWANKKRRWKATRDFGDTIEEQAAAIDIRRAGLAGDDSQNVKTFVADHWTLEYDLARCGHAKLVYEAAMLAKKHDAICDGKKTADQVKATAAKAFARLSTACGNDPELIAIYVYDIFRNKNASKAIAAQYLAIAFEILSSANGFDAIEFRNTLPTYIVDGIAHACGSTPIPPPQEEGVAAAPGAG